MGKTIELKALIVAVALLTAAVVALTGGLTLDVDITPLSVTSPQTPHSDTSSLVVINELMVNNTQSTQNPEGNYSDWIEIYNLGDINVDLSGMYLTDNLTDYKWQFPNGTVIAGHGFVLVWADNDMQAGGLHTNFRLNKAGEEIGLFSESGMLLDSVVYGRQLSDVSFGRTVDGGDEWSFFTDPTPGEPNEAVNSLFNGYPWQVWAVVGAAVAVVCVLVVFEGKLWRRKRK